MREIKFRIWDNPTNKMYFDVLVGNCNGENTCPCVFINEKGWVHTDNCIIEQFTGLHDKNGVEIYEGDILCADGYWDIVIEFENGSFMCKALNKVQYVNKTINVPISNFDLLRLYEVIGNIHERSEDND